MGKAQKGEKITGYLDQLEASQKSKNKKRIIMGSAFAVFLAAAVAFVTIDKTKGGLLASNGANLNSGSNPDLVPTDPLDEKMRKVIAEEGTENPEVSPASPEETSLALNEPAAVENVEQVSEETEAPLAETLPVTVPSAPEPEPPSPEDNPVNESSETGLRENIPMAQTFPESYEGTERASNPNSVNRPVTTPASNPVSSRKVNTPSTSAIPNDEFTEKGGEPAVPVSNNSEDYDKNDMLKIKEDLQKLVDKSEESTASTRALPPTLPAYPGGKSKMRTFISNRVSYPQEAKSAGVEGTVYASLEIDESGNIKSTKILKGLGHGLDQEVLRVLENMPKWKPATRNGLPVSQNVTVPVTFKLN